MAVPQVLPTVPGTGDVWAQQLNDAIASLHLGPDVHANLPAANAVPLHSVYACTTHSVLHQTNGSTWVDYFVGGSGGSGTGVATPAKTTRLRKAATQSITASTWTSMQWDVEDSDDLNGHDNVTNNSRVVVPATGAYVVSASITLGTVSATWYVQFAVNGVQVPGRTLFQSNANTSGTLTRTLWLNAGDYVETKVYGGSSMVTAIFSDDQSVMSVTALSGAGAGTPPNTTTAILSADFTSTINDAWVQVPDLTITYTPPSDGVLLVIGNIASDKPTSGRFFVRTLISPSPPSGQPDIMMGQPSGANRFNVAILNSVKVTGGTAYTITTYIGQGGGGAMNVRRTGDFGQIESLLNATFIPGGGVTAFPPGSADVHPTNPNAKDDEFDSATTLLSIATPTAAAAADSNTRPSHLHLKASGTGAAYVGLYQAVPGAYPYTITTKLAGSTARANYQRGGGIILLPAAPTNATNIYYAGRIVTSHQRVLAQAGGTFVSQSVAGLAVPDVSYFRVKVNSATSVDFLASTDGWAWYTVEAGFNPGFTPAFMGLAINDETAAVGVDAYFDFFRVT